MTTVGMCMICGKPAMYTCALCGRLVCREHYNSTVGMCAVCTPKIKRAEGSDEERPLGPAQ